MFLLSLMLWNWKLQDRTLQVNGAFLLTPEQLDTAANDITEAGEIRKDQNGIGKDEMRLWWERRMCGSGPGRGWVWQQILTPIPKFNPAAWIHAHLMPAISLVEWMIIEFSHIMEAYPQVREELWRKRRPICTLLQDAAATILAPMHWQGENPASYRVGCVSPVTNKQLATISYSSVLYLRGTRKLFQSHAASFESRCFWMSTAI